ncbi:phospholipase D-like domain-containing protein [Thalassospira tepidiphila]|uniref:phospholipase D-like domain-containing protein n=1 Tax=Thalassospira tepidiphila TaxID=393657 RepID=UPI003AA8FB8C
MPETRENCAAEFLLNGDAFFSRLNKSLNSVLSSATNDQGAQNENRVVRTAFWMMDTDVELPKYPGGKAVKLTDILEQIASKGVPVQLIVWAGPSILNNFKMLEFGMYSNWGIERWANEVNERNANISGYKPIRVLMESYGGFTQFGMSNHQKIAVISDGLSKEAFVGGLNVSQFYMNPSWRDAAVCVTGPIVEDIESEWIRRWCKHWTAPEPKGPVGLSSPSKDGMKITMLITNSEHRAPKTEIRDRLIRRVQESKGYVYLENYALTDPFLVNELARRKEQGVDVIPIVSRSSEDNPFSYLMFYTYIQLAFSDLESFKVIENFSNFSTARPIEYHGSKTDSSLVKFNRYNWRTNAILNPATDYMVEFKEMSGIAKEFYFHDIVDIIPKKPIIFCPRKTYPHAKIAMIDDKYLIVGSCNWTYRSLQYDGEIALEIDDEAFVRDLRSKLFKSWDLPQVAAIDDAMSLGPCFYNIHGWQNTGLQPMNLKSFYNPWRSGSLRSRRMRVPSGGAGKGKYIAIFASAFL